MKETLSDAFHNMEKLDCFNVKGVTHEVREFIQKLKGELCRYGNLCGKNIKKCETCIEIDKLAGSQLINTASPSAPGTSHSPQERYGDTDDTIVSSSTLPEDNHDKVCADCGIHISEHDRYWKNGDNFPCKKFKPECSKEKEVGE